MSDVVHDGIVGPHVWRNNQKMVPAAESAWDVARRNNMLGIRVAARGTQNRLVDLDTQREFVNLSSCSYLGLNSHPDVIQGGIDALRDEGITGLSMAEFRIRLGLMEELEHGLAQQFGGPVVPAVTCSALTAAILPLLASGHLTDGEPMVMVFDRFAHFSMAFMKPVVADESLVLTCGHNDMDELEAICKRYPRVAYVCDGVYSVGGVARLDRLLDLQARYGLFLYVDDSHSLSVEGGRGEGYIRSRLPELNDRTIIVASIAKAFGSTGGIAMLPSPRHFDFLYRSGPLGWSQSLRTAAIGTSLGSLKVHRSDELARRQRQLRENIALFDRHIDTPQRGNGLNIKVVEVGTQERAVFLSNELYRRGFYCSAVFFPIVARDRAGIRVMLRGDLPTETMQRFIDVLTALLDDLNEAPSHY
ncbi:aminotransferase class I/II-fold pyridoxal phosphate-dependent enzyme [Burkholderia multivorans]|uniref:aminotransferase class I/II-fold pyridoxal phosphate-dependent enzyme n=1 Tax=Burkholderia ubonensis TaxID=101571 RepID=UPI000F6E3876|nr:aminotransferase class I/II-fold pyridoxal phosphate-dependent enzyme [Burkholderia ubonensis]AYZ66589.1 aminotransferase class I/II-fold pyridoxal phosphate-dependent enzyme [Burkholderia multivorans]VWC00153.1 8-amino-7-oxononanoate synthase [Burkholderia ubonensis]